MIPFHNLFGIQDFALSNDVNELSLWCVVTFCIVVFTDHALVFGKRAFLEQNVGGGVDLVPGKSETHAWEVIVHEVGKLFLFSLDVLFEGHVECYLVELQDDAISGRSY